MAGDPGNCCNIHPRIQQGNYECPTQITRAKGLDAGSYPAAPQQDIKRSAGRKRSGEVAQSWPDLWDRGFELAEDDRRALLQALDPVGHAEMCDDPG